MDSSTNHNYHQQSNPGLSRFNSAPTALLVNFTDSLESGGVNKSSFESERLISRFMNSGGDNSNNSSFQEFEVKSPVSYGNSQQSCSGLPPHYPRQSSAMDHNSYDLFLDQSSRVKSVNSNLVRQSSSPAGLFAKLSAQNGIFILQFNISVTVLCEICLLTFFILFVSFLMFLFRFYI